MRWGRYTSSADCSYRHSHACRRQRHRRLPSHPEGRTGPQVVPLRRYTSQLPLDGYGAHHAHVAVEPLQGPGPRDAEGLSPDGARGRERGLHGLDVRLLQAAQEARQLLCLGCKLLNLLGERVALRGNRNITK
jgi:hypothetical protein